MFIFVSISIWVSLTSRASCFGRENTPIVCSSKMFHPQSQEEHFWNNNKKQNPQSQEHVCIFLVQLNQRSSLADGLLVPSTYLYTHSTLWSPWSTYLYSLYSVCRLFPVIRVIHNRYTSLHSSVSSTLCSVHTPYKEFPKQVFCTDCLSDIHFTLQFTMHCVQQGIAVLQYSIWFLSFHNTLDISSNTVQSHSMTDKLIACIHRALISSVLVLIRALVLVLLLVLVLAVILWWWGDSCNGCRVSLDQSARAPHSEWCSTVGRIIPILDEQCF